MSQYQPAPAGEIEVEIVAASMGTVAWKVNDANPTGECLRLRLTAGRGYAFVFVDVPSNWASSLKAISAAVGIPVEQLRPEVLAGRRARVTLRHYTAKDGSTRAAVARWLPAAGDAGQAVAEPAAATTPASAAQPAAPQAKPATAKVSRNAPPAYGPDDDIPF